MGQSSIRLRLRDFPLLGPGVCGGDEVVDRAECVTTESAVGRRCEPALHKVEPPRRGGAARITVMLAPTLLWL